jgi:glucose-1-phosphate adenylyltransferase
VKAAGTTVNPEEVPVQRKVLSIVLGGGKGSRLFPLTKERSKPAVPFGGKYRIVDIPISNCINSGFRQIYILTQYNSASLHLHLARAYSFDSFSSGFCEILAAEQTPENMGWYEGTADAVRKNLIHFRPQKPSHYIILSGDQLYRMDLADMYERHIESGAQLSVACTPVDRAAASAFGIMKADENNAITEFMEKPGPTKDISGYRLPDRLMTNRDPEKRFLASMGIYIFNAETMERALETSYTDFGSEIIPDLITKVKSQAYIFDGYWEDIGTIKSFYEANLNLTDINPSFNFYDEMAPIFTRKRNLPASKINNCTINQAICSDGCIITNSIIQKSVVGVRSIIESGAKLDGVICMGSDYFETEEQKLEDARDGQPAIGIGSGSFIKNAIIDKNARIGKNCRIGIENRKREDGDYGSYYIVDGIIIIPKGAIIREGTQI